MPHEPSRLPITQSPGRTARRGPRRGRCTGPGLPARWSARAAGTRPRCGAGLGQGPGGKDVAQGMEGPRPAPLGSARPSCGSCGRLEGVAPIVRPPGPAPLGRREHQPVRADLGEPALDHGGQVKAAGVRAGYMVVRLRRFLGGPRESSWRVSTTWRSTVMHRRPTSTRSAVSPAISPQRSPE